MILKANRIFGITPFVITSIILIFIVSIPALAVLRVPLILAHIFVFYSYVFYSKQKLGLNFGLVVLLTLLLYALLQSLVLQDDWIVIAQSIGMVLILLLTTQIAQLNAVQFYDHNRMNRLARKLLIIYPFFCVSFNAWSDTRSAGLFMNPNITAHMAVMLLPFIMLGIRTFKFRLLAVFIAFAISIVTASRSATMALALSIGAFALFSFFPRLRFISILLVVLSATLISAYGVDIVSAVIAKYSITGDSRLLYTGYNSRDILMQIAIERFKGQPWFGLGFDGAKFELDGHELGTHNGLLDLLLRFGIIGTSIFAIFMLYLGFMISRQKKPFKPVSAMAIVAIMSLSTNSSTFFVFNYLFLYVVVLIYVGYFNRKN